MFENVAYYPGRCGQCYNMMGWTPEDWSPYIRFRAPKNYRQGGWIPEKVCSWQCTQFTTKKQVYESIALPEPRKPSRWYDLSIEILENIRTFGLEGPAQGVWGRYLLETPHRWAVTANEEEDICEACYIRRRFKWGSKMAEIPGVVIEETDRYAPAGWVEHWFCSWEC